MPLFRVGDIAMPILVSDKYEASKIGVNVRFGQLKVDEGMPGRIFAAFGSCVVSCASPLRFVSLTAGGCLCFVLRAAPFVCRLIASQLSLAISFRFGARTPCCGHGLDHRRRQSHCRSGKLEQLNNRFCNVLSFKGKGYCESSAYIWKGAA